MKSVESIKTFPTNSPKLKMSPDIGDSFWSEITVNLDFSIIGAPKSATTWLFSCMIKHPRIFIPGEQNFFTIHQKKGPKYYNDLYRGHKHHVKGDYSNTYMIDENLPQCFFAKWPKMKIIMVSRNPVDRAFSHYLMEVRRGTIKPEKTNFIDVLKEPITYSFYDNGLYYKHLKKFMEFFPLENIYVTTVDSISTKPNQVLKDVFGLFNLHFPENFELPKIKNSYEVRKVNHQIQHLNENRIISYTREKIKKYMPQNLIKIFSGIRNIIRLYLLKYNKVTYFIKKHNHLSRNLKYHLIELYRKDNTKLRYLFPKNNYDSWEF